MYTAYAFEIYQTNFKLINVTTENKYYLEQCGLSRISRLYKLISIENENEHLIARIVGELVTVFDNNHMIFETESATKEASLSLIHKMALKEALNHLNNKKIKVEK